MPRSKYQPSPADVQSGWYNDRNGTKDTTVRVSKEDPVVTASKENTAGQMTVQKSDGTTETVMAAGGGIPSAAAIAKALNGDGSIQPDGVKPEGEGLVQTKGNWYVPASNSYAKSHAVAPEVEFDVVDAPSGLFKSDAEPTAQQEEAAEERKEAKKQEELENQGLEEDEEETEKSMHKHKKMSKMAKSIEAMRELVMIEQTTPIVDTVESDPLQILEKALGPDWGEIEVSEGAVQALYLAGVPVFEDGMVKGAGHKYIRREKKEGGGYRYFYNTTSAGTGSIALQAKEGMDLMLTHDGKKGHFKVLSASNDKVTMKHDESNQTVTMTRSELSRLVHKEHKQALREKQKGHEATGAKQDLKGGAKAANTKAQKKAYEERKKAVMAARAAQKEGHKGSDKSKGFEELKAMKGTKPMGEGITFQKKYRSDVGAITGVLKTTYTAKDFTPATLQKVKALLESGGKAKGSMMENAPAGGWTDADKVPKKDAGIKEYQGSYFAPGDKTAYESKEAAMAAAQKGPAPKGGDQQMVEFQKKTIDRAKKMGIEASSGGKTVTSGSPTSATAGSGSAIEQTFADPSAVQISDSDLQKLQKVHPSLKQNKDGSVSTSAFNTALDKMEKQGGDSGPSSATAKAILPKFKEGVTDEQKAPYIAAANELAAQLDAAPAMPSNAKSADGFAAKDVVDGKGPYKPGDVLHKDHNSMESAYVIDDYPYGSMRTKMRVWYEHNKKGTRSVSQTQNPKTGNWNKPKKSTYDSMRIAKFDAKGHLEHHGFSALGPEKAHQFLDHGGAQAHLDDTDKKVLVASMAKFSKKTEKSMSTMYEDLIKAAGGGTEDIIEKAIGEAKGMSGGLPVSGPPHEMPKKGPPNPFDGGKVEGACGPGTSAQDAGMATAASTSGVSEKTCSWADIEYSQDDEDLFQMAGGQAIGMMKKGDGQGTFVSSQDRLEKAHQMGTQLKAAIANITNPDETLPEFYAKSVEPEVTAEGEEVLTSTRGILTESNSEDIRISKAMEQYDRDGSGHFASMSVASLDIRSPLAKSRTCGSCGSLQKSYTTVCEDCGSGAVHQGTDYSEDVVEALSHDASEV